MEERTGTIAGAGGATLFARWIGNAGPVVPVLHGGPGASHDYLRPQFDALASGRTLLYYDQRGGGRSPVEREADVSWRAHVADLDAVITAHATAPVTLLGFSWGGLLALLYCLEHPGAVARLGLVAPAPAWPEARERYNAEFERRQAAPEVAAARGDLSASGLREKDPDAFWRRAFELSVAGYFREPARARALTPFRVAARVQQAVWHSLRGLDLRNRLHEITAETLVLHGRHDPVPLDSSELLTRLMPHAKLVVFEDSGHALYAEEPGRFVEVLGGWLDGEQAAGSREQGQ